MLLLFSVGIQDALEELLVPSKQRAVVCVPR